MEATKAASQNSLALETCAGPCPDFQTLEHILPPLLSWLHRGRPPSPHIHLCRRYLPFRFANSRTFLISLRFVFWLLRNSCQTPWDTISLDFKGWSLNQQAVQWIYKQRISSRSQPSVLHVATGRPRGEDSPGGLTVSVWNPGSPKVPTKNLMYTRTWDILQNLEGLNRLFPAIKIRNFLQVSLDMKLSGCWVSVIS